ncbi:MAG: hypothetical protein AB8G11_06640 [Saprospiraceae bacterium]
MKFLKPTITFVLLFSLTVAFSQSKLKFAERLIYGTSLNYDKNSYSGITTVDFSWHNNLAVNITPALYFGLGFTHIRTRITNSTDLPHKKTHNMMVAFLQYDALPKKKARFFPEISWGYGNYCICEFDNPFQEESLHYIGFGGGFELPIKERLSINAGVMSYSPLHSSYSLDREYNRFNLGLSFNIINSNNSLEDQILPL